MDNECVYVVTTAFPFVPANLNLAHFSSTYVPADIIYRYLKMFGYKAVQVNATDVHSFYASKDGKTIEKKEIEKYNHIYNDLYKIMNIEYDNYLLTSDYEHIKFTESVIKELYAKDFLIQRLSVSSVCSGCKGVVPNKMVETKELVYCPYCGRYSFYKNIYKSLVA